MPSVALLGTLDTKGREYAFLSDRLVDLGVDTVVIDAGVAEPVGIEPDVDRRALAAAAGSDTDALAAAGDRGAAVEAMARGAERVVSELYAAGRFDGILAIGGSGGTAIAAMAMQSLPVGVPKLLVSTVASGDTRPYVGAVDVAMMYSVVDLAGINTISARILANAAAAIGGMVSSPPLPDTGRKPLIGATMFGVTTPCVTRARERLEDLGYEVLVFHATGTGGRSLEALARDGSLAGVLDITTTELADELVGGVLSAGPLRLEAAGVAGIPQVVSLGALDMVNFGPPQSIPPVFADRRFYVHNPTVTLMRTTPEEVRGARGRRVGIKLAAARGPVAVFVPLRGVSMIDSEGQPFHDPEADEALFRGLRQTFTDRELHELDMNINDERFADAMARRLDELIAQTR